MATNTFVWPGQLTSGTRPQDFLKLLRSNPLVIVFYIPILFLLYAVVLAIYRLYFSPLSRFPGPKFTAASGWYEFYFDVIKHGMFVYTIAEMHEKYGESTDFTRELYDLAVSCWFI
jgi:hypothetical protein